MKVAVVVGHTTGADKGAFSKFLKSSEQPFNKMVADELKALAPHTYDVYVHQLQSYYDRQKVMAAKLNLQNYDLIIELHFNAADSETANGTEACYYYASRKGKDAAQHISIGLAMAYGTKLRSAGAKALVNKNDRGYWFTYLPKAPAIIVEPFFGTNPESEKFADVAKYAKELHHLISNLTL